jgi:hypothetical protein
LFLTRGIASLTIDEVFSLVHSDFSIGGLNVLPLRPYHHSFTYVPFPYFILKYSRPTEIEPTFPDHYTTIFTKASDAIGLRYSPSRRFSASFFVEHRTRIIDVKIAHPTPHSDFSFPEEHLISITRSILQGKQSEFTVRLPTLSSDYIVYPFWADLLRFAHKNGRAPLLFTSHVYAKYLTLFSAKDFINFASFGLPSVSIFSPCISKDVISVITTTLMTYILHDRMTKGYRPFYAMLDSISIFIVHFLDRHLHQIYNEAPFYHGS